MTFQQFANKYNGKYAKHPMGLGKQCMDVYRLYVDEVLKLPQSPGVIGAADIWNTYLKDHFDRIENTPEAIPQEGDIIIWQRASSLPYGHVAICANAGQLTFTSFDQNYPTGSPCHFQNHRYVNVLGWIRAKVVSEVITDQTKIDLGDMGVLEVQAIRSILKDNIRDLANKDKKIYELENMVDELVKKVAELTKIISDLQSQVDKLNENPSVVTIPASEWELNEVEKSFVANLVEKIRKFFGF
jgi:hypothetical protein